jgi:hypothetical protein
MLNFESFNNSTVKKNIPSTKVGEMSNLIGKRSEININTQKDIFRVESYDSRSKENQSRVSSLKRRKMSDTSKQKDLINQSEFDSMNPLNRQQSANSNFKSFQANNSMLEFSEDQQKPRKKKIRHSVGISQKIPPIRETQISKKSAFGIKLPVIANIPAIVRSDKKDLSSQNISSLNDISSSIKYRINSNTQSSNSNKNVSSLNELEKFKNVQMDSLKNEKKNELNKKKLPKICESENTEKIQKKKK